MASIQLITLEGAHDDAVHTLVANWHAEQAGVAPGYQGCRVLADDATGRPEVDFAARALKPAATTTDPRPRRAPNGCTS